ncbi:MAG: FAD-dependent oxidoreductase [Vicinamibacterales bacterium]
MNAISRRQFLSAALIGLVPKSGPRLAGGFVFESQVIGHQIRDRVPFPTPRVTRQSPIVIVGGGIAGLSAAWRLLRHGVTDFVVLEMESVPGGNARSGSNDVSAFPWGAHYVPVPGRSAGLVRELFTDLGLFDGHEWVERHLVHAPRERLFIHGRWQEGLEPAVGPTARDRSQFDRFDDRIEQLRQSGRFTVPMAAGFDGRVAPDEDTLSMAAWLDREGFDSPWLRWQIDYACRDDYGALAADVSAWAGLHYFAAREREEEGPLTWPNGNGWIVQRLVERIGSRLLTAQIVHRIEKNGSRFRILTPDVAWDADAVIVAAPLLVATRIVADAPRVDITYSPWFTANLTLDRWPAERGGGEPAWDNVVFDSPSLGYVVATHQRLERYIPRTVWTYYHALAHDKPDAARRWLLAQEWSSLSAQILGDLRRAHPDIDTCVRRLDIFRIGHAMVRPTVGFLADPGRRALQTGTERFRYAHSDLSGLPLFEEAQYRGVMAADAVLHDLGERSGR